MQRPRIGITTSYTEEGRQALDHAYVRAIEAAGGLPLIVPMLTSDEAAHDFASLLDGLLITGGPGIVDGLVGALPVDLPPVHPVRDASDKRIFAAMSDKPMLGICYGMQFINARAGGQIYADVQAQQPGVQPHSPGRGGVDHPVNFTPDSRLANLLGSQVLVNTYHVQALASVGAGLRAVGYGPDGVIEAIESADGRTIGVQFHPERMDERAAPLFTDFVARCRA